MAKRKPKDMYVSVEQAGKIATHYISEYHNHVVAPLKVKPWRQWMFWLVVLTFVLAVVK